jgi:hypothetical protein
MVFAEDMPASVGDMRPKPECNIYAPEAQERNFIPTTAIFRRLICPTRSLNDFISPSPNWLFTV